MKIKQAVLFSLIALLILSACSSAAQMAPEAEGEVGLDRGFGGSSEEFGDMAEAPQEEALPSTGNAEVPAQRLVIKNANLSIVVPDPGESMDEIAQMAEEMGGFVVTSELYRITNAQGMEFPRAQITIRVPAERLNVALDEIKSGAGEVLSENISGQDVTREYTDLKSRVRNLEATESQLQEIMEDAFKTEDVLRVYNELTRVREQIEVIQGQIQYYEQAAALSSIAVDLEAEEAIEPLTIGRWQPAGVASDAIQALINALQVIVNAAIWIILFILPIALVIFIPILLVILFIRRRRSKKKAETPSETEA